MTKHLAKNLVDLSSWSLRPNRTAELSLNHGEDSFDIGPLVVMLQEGFPIEVVEVPHPIPQPVRLVMMVVHASRVRLERDECRTTLRLNSAQILSVGVGFVGGNFIDSESPCSPAHQSGELQVISRLKGSGFDTGDDVGFDTANQVCLYPSLLTPRLAVLVVEPSGISSGGEAGGINGEVGLYRPERAGTLLNESLEQGCEFGILQIAEGAGERRGLSDQSLSFRFPQVGHETPAGHCSVDLASNTEHDISQWQSRATKLVFGLGYAVAEVWEQGNKPLLLVGLCLIVGWPLLGAGHFDRLGVGGVTIGLSLSLDDKLDSVNVLARLVAFLEIGAGAKRLAVVEVYDVASVARLGGDFPAQLVFLNLACVCYHQSSFFSCVHLNTPSPNSLFYIYNSIFCMPLSIVYANFSRF